MKDNYLIIMAGGIGSRFWPMSTSDIPKQFLDILGVGKSMIQQTVSRFSDLIPQNNIYIVTSGAYKSLVEEQLPSIPKSQILLEPCMRNTAPCIAYASYRILKENPNANIVVAPSDHLITDETKFREIIAQGLEFISDDDVLLTLGIKAHRSETGYGYIETSKSDVESISDIDVKITKVEEFKEKPTKEVAQGYIDAGNFLWNSGIFLWSVSSITKAFELYLPELAQRFSDLMPILGTDREQEMIDTEFPLCESISIDYGILERASNIYVLPADFGWSDLGTWGSLWEERSRDINGNSVVGEGVHLFDCKDSIITVPDSRTVVLQGLNNSIVVESNGVILICNKDEEQRIKEFQSIVNTRS